MSDLNDMAKIIYANERPTSGMCAARIIADAILAAGFRRAKPAADPDDGGWIACSAARPHAGTPVEMRWRDGSTEIGEWRDRRQCMLGTRAGECGPGLVSVLADYLPADDVTHWRPLPVPPATTTTDKGEA